MTIQKIRQERSSVRSAASRNIGQTKPRLRSAATMLPAAPTAAASETLAMPERIEPSTATTSRIGKISPFREESRSLQVNLRSFGGSGA